MTQTIRTFMLAALTVAGVAPLATAQPKIPPPLDVPCGARIEMTNTSSHFGTNYWIVYTVKHGHGVPEAVAVAVIPPASEGEGR